MKIIKAVTGSEGGEKVSKLIRLGKTMPGKKRPLLVRFKEYGDMENFMDNQKKLEGTEFKTDDLTPSQHQQLKKAVNWSQTKARDWVRRQGVPGGRQPI